jgi:hypothetical protein
MGCCLSCFKGYRSIPNDERVGIMMNDRYANNFTGYEHFPQPTGAIDRGTEVDIKFTSKFSYSKKFIWINKRTLTINMSKYSSKERSHKEASLSDLTSVIAGPPAIYKPIDMSTGMSNSSLPAQVDGKLCLTINFSKGGGIDIKFSTEEERNLWFTELNNIVLRQGKLQSVPMM